MVLCALSAVLLALTPSIGSAQERRFHVNLGGGPTFNSGALGEHFGTGWGPAVGVTIDSPSQRRFLSVRVRLPLLQHQGRRPRLRGDPVFRQPPDAPVGLQCRCESGEARQRGSPVYRCRPWLLQPQREDHGVRRQWRHLRPVLVRVRHLPGHRRGRIARRLGFRVQRRRRRRIRLGDSAEFYIETRYHYVAGPEITPTVNPLDGSETGKANGHYTPLTFGFRF